jgi:hypothetical protein
VNVLARKLHLGERQERQHETCKTRHILSGIATKMSTMAKFSLAGILKTDDFEQFQPKFVSNQ